MHGNLSASDAGPLPAELLDACAGIAGTACRRSGRSRPVFGLGSWVAVRTKT